MRVYLSTRRVKMTDYYTEFCFSYPCENEAQVQWAVDFWHDLTLKEDAVDERFEVYVDEFLDKFDWEWIEIEVSRVTWGDEPCVQISSGSDNGNPDHAAWFVQVLMQEFKHEQVVSFGWGSTASRMVMDAYGGGAVTVTPKCATFHNPFNNDWDTRLRYERGFFGYWKYRLPYLVKSWRNYLSQPKNRRVAYG